MQDKRKHFDNSIIKGKLTLPISIVMTLLLWGRGDLYTSTTWIAFALTSAICYLLIGMQKNFSLIRTHVALLPAIYLVLIATCNFTHHFSKEMMALPTLAIANFSLFTAYKHRRPERQAYACFLSLGFGSMFFPPILYIIPLFYISMAINLRIFTLQSLSASILGLLTPYWGYMGLLILQNKSLSELLPKGLIETNLLDFSTLSLPQIISATFIFLLSLTAFFHFLRNAFYDKLQTRMYLYILLVESLFFICATLLLPHHLNTWLLLLIFTATPLIAHYFALSNSRKVIFSFFFYSFLLLLIALFNLNILNENIINNIYKIIQ